jgi:hypothetical protein
MIENEKDINEENAQDDENDTSEQAERKRTYKREKMQRYRIRKKIEAGTATVEEICAISDFDDGYEWVHPTRETPVTDDETEEAPAKMPRRAQVSARYAQEEDDAQEDAQEDEEDTQGESLAWKPWQILTGVGVGVAALVGALWLGAKTAAKSV